MSELRPQFPEDEFSMSAHDHEAFPDWLFAEQEDRIREADELPFLRPSLRREFVAELKLIQTRSDRRRRVTLTLLAFLALTPLWWWPRPAPASAVAQRLPVEARPQDLLPVNSIESVAM